MNTKYTATLIKSGNSYALRLPKWVVEASGLTAGDIVEGPALLPTSRHRSNKLEIQQAVRNLQTAVANNPGGMIANIKDPVAWQREMRNLDKPLPGRDY